MNVIKNILKIAGAGIVAVALLSGIFAFYYLQPAHIDNTQGNTDYVWIANSRWLKMTEGISWGRFDADGYNNETVVENPDIMVLGSSHTEATNVPQGSDFSALLAEKLSGDYSVYNMGISGHHFLKVCQYLPQNLARYETAPKAVIIETDNLTFTAQEIEAMLAGDIAKSPSYNTGFIALTQKSPFFAALYSQVQGGLIDLLMPDKAKLLDLATKAEPFVPLSVLSPSSPVMSEEEALNEAYTKLFRYLDGLQQEYNTQIIIFNHIYGEPQPDGSAKFVHQDIIPLFAEMCDSYNISFVDMTDHFEEVYRTEHILPHGFVTGKIGYGHLNADGHAMIADVLYQTVLQLNEEGRLCR